jgi:hypothetical protein
MYDFVRSPTDSTHLLLHAGKIVNGALVPMGDLDLAFEDSTASWVGEFANARVHIEWRYTLAGGTLTGTLLELPDRRVARRVTVTRVSGAGKD